MTEGAPRELVIARPSALEFVGQVASKLQPGEMARGRQVLQQEPRVGAFPDYPRMRTVESTLNTFELRRINEKVIVVGIQVNDNPRQIEGMLEASFVISGGKVLSGKSVRKPDDEGNTVTPLVEHRAFSNEELSEAEIKALEAIRDGVLGGQLKLEVFPIADTPKFMRHGFRTTYMTEDTDSHRIEGSRRFGSLVTEEQFQGRATDNTTTERESSNR